MPHARIITGALACALVVTSCTDDEAAVPMTSTPAMAVVAGEPFPAARCAENRAAGTITYLSGFDFAASASIVDVLVAEQKGYFEDLCLDVDVVSSDASLNSAQIASGSAQFASAGSFSAVVGYRNEHPDAGLVALAVEGRTSIDALVVKEGLADTLADLRGGTIGFKGQIPPSIRAMLTQAGLVEGTDYETTPLDGYDPTVHIAVPGIVGFPVFTSNEPGQLDRAGIPFTLFDPADVGVPGSFGVIYSSRSFMEAHPTAAEDFMRAAMRGLADAVADPSAASMIALDFIDNNGNPSGLSPDTETFRWQTESSLVVDSTPEDEPLGRPDRAQLNAEVDAYAEIGLYGGTAPDIADAFDASVLDAVYDDGALVIWPTSVDTTN